jgi:hypothetical protein
LICQLVPLATLVQVIAVWPRCASPALVGAAMTSTNAPIATANRITTMGLPSQVYCLFYMQMMIY